jgi:iron complex transport system substrate-binding protein
MTVGTNAFLSELVHLAGGRNIGDDVEKDYFQTSSEWVVAKNPEIILCLYMSDKGSAKEDVLRRAGWQSVKAVRQGTVYDGFNNDLVLRPGPRVLQSIELLKKRIQPSGSP